MHKLSREDTMVEHSVVMNEESEAQIIVSDYMKALESVKLDQVVSVDSAPNQSGEFNLEHDIESGEDINGKKNKLLKLSNEDDVFVEKILMQIRDRIRGGIPLSHQIANDRKLDSDIESNGSRNDILTGMVVKENEYSPGERSENVISSGVNNFRINKHPIGTNEATETSSGNLVLSSKPSIKNKNLSRRPILELNPKKATSLIGPNPTSYKVSPASILKPPKKFVCEQTIDSG